MRVALAVTILLLISGTAFAAEQSSSQDSSSPGSSGDSSGQQPEVPPDAMETDVSMITNNPATWPEGDRIWDVARAIAIAEGANVAGSNPDRLNNPGDISDGFATYGGEAHSGSNVTHFPDKQTGWQWLYDKLNRIAQGESSSYSPAWTWTRFAQTYAGNWQAWVTNVTRELGVDKNSTFGEYVNG